MNQPDLFEQTIKQKFLESLHNGESLDCPVCGRFAKKYKAKVMSGSAANMISLFKKGGVDSFIHFTDFHVAGSGFDFWAARHIGLVVQNSNEDEDKKTSGCWKLTSKGEAFITKRLKIPKYVEIFNDAVIAVAQESVDIEHCLGNKFSYKQLMEG